MTEGKGKSRKRTRKADVVQRADVAPVERAVAIEAATAVGIEAAAMETIGAGPLGDGMPTAVADSFSDEAIRARAYQLYLERGRVSGRELDDWLAAERSLRGRGPDGPSAA